MSENMVTDGCHSLAELLEHVKGLRELGVSSFKMGGYEVLFNEKSNTSAPSVIPPVVVHNIPAPDMTEKELEKLFKHEPAQMTEEEIKYYATSYFDYLQALKEAHKKKLEDEKV